MIIWLVSYPKSGNTWVRALFSAYLYDRPVDINRMHGTPIASSRMMLNRQLGFPTDKLSDEEIEALRPQAYRNLSKQYDRRGLPALVKVHDAFKTAANGAPLFPADVTHGTIYIVRHPLDVAVSLSHHLGVTIEAVSDWMTKENFMLFSAGEDGSPKKAQVKQVMGSWQRHVSSWLDESGLRIHLVKYEDLHADTARAFEGILLAMGYTVSQQRLQRAVHACRFAALQSQELLHRFREQSRKADTPFFRSGRVGSYREEMPQGCIDALAKYNAAAMARLSYQP